MTFRLPPSPPPSMKFRPPPPLNYIPEHINPDALINFAVPENPFDDIVLAVEFTRLYYLAGVHKLPLTQQT